MIIAAGDRVTPKCGRCLNAGIECLPPDVKILKRLSDPEEQGSPLSFSRPRLLVLTAAFVCCR